MKTKFVTSAELGSCPAAVDMKRGIIKINRDEWHRYDDFERLFILLHEEGHYILQTDSEYEADIYALQRVAGRVKKSLARSMEVLYKVGIIDDQRYESLYREALQLDYEMGNNDALNELKKIEKMSNKTNRIFGNRVNRIDGRVEPRRSHKTNGFVIGDYYLSFTNVLLILIAVMMICINSKVGK